MSEEKIREAATEVVKAHKSLILGVTPKHPEWCADDREEYEARFSKWHSSTRKLADALGIRDYA